MSRLPRVVLRLCAVRGARAARAPRRRRRDCGGKARPGSVERGFAGPPREPREGPEAGRPEAAAEHIAERIELHHGKAPKRCFPVAALIIASCDGAMTDAAHPCRMTLRQRPLDACARSCQKPSNGSRSAPECAHVLFPFDQDRAVDPVRRLRRFRPRDPRDRGSGGRLGPCRRDGRSFRAEPHLRAARGQSLPQTRQDHFHQ